MQFLPSLDYLVLRATARWHKFFLTQVPVLTVLFRSAVDGHMPTLKSHPRSEVACSSIMIRGTYYVR